ncbi:Inner membrane protein YbaN [Roseibium album]|nr:Inner membrane protein YbaN [Roseibium album]
MRRFTFKLLGTGCVGVGIAGAFLPILPSTIFFIMAAACFARSSPALEDKILKHPVFGPPVVAWREYGAISTRSKIIALAGMAFGFGLFYYSANPNPWLAITVAIFMLGCGIYVATRPSGPKENLAE